MSLAPTASIRGSMSAFLWIRQLSKRTQAPSHSWGTTRWAINASNVRASVEPVKFSRAIIPVRLKAPIIETFFPLLLGRLPLARLPFAERAINRVKARWTPDSSMKTRSFASRSWTVSQKSTRLRWTRSLSFSLAWSVFFWMWTPTF